MTRFDRDNLLRHMLLQLLCVVGASFTAGHVWGPWVGSFVFFVGFFAVVSTP